MTRRKVETALGWLLVIGIAGLALYGLGVNTLRLFLGLCVILGPAMLLTVVLIRLLAGEWP